MGDIIRNNDLSVLKRNIKLQDKHIEIQIKEKESQMKALKLRLEDLIDIEAKKISFQIDVLEDEVKLLNEKRSIEHEKLKEN